MVPPALLFSPSSLSPLPPLPPLRPLTNHFSLRYPTSFIPCLLHLLFPPHSFVLLHTYTCSEARASIFHFTWTLIVHLCAHRRAERRQQMQNRRMRWKKRGGREARHTRTNHSVDRRLERRVRRNGRGRIGGMKRGRMAVRRTWWTVYGCQEEPMASHMHLTSLYEREQAAL